MKACRNPECANDEVSLVTVGIPAFNHENYIEATLNSVSLSNHRKIELVIVDDGSADRTPILISEWLEVNGGVFINTVFLQQENQGVCKTLNTIVAHAKGQYIALVASDDTLDENSISERLHALKSSGKGVVVSDSRHISESGVVLGTTILGAKRRFLYPLFFESTQLVELLLGWRGYGPGMMFDVSSLGGENCFDESLAYEDFEFLLKHSATGNVLFLPDILQSYRVVSTSFSHQSNIQGLQARESDPDFGKSIRSVLPYLRGVNRFVALLVLYKFEQRKLALPVSVLCRTIRRINGLFGLVLRMCFGRVAESRGARSDR